MQKNIEEINKFSKKTLVVKIGEIFWCYLGINIGSEQNGAGINLIRPVIILSVFSDNFFLVAPMTSKKHIGDWYFKITFRDSYVILNQIRPIDIKRLIKIIGRVDG
jgi:mRNA-degrading endonuclease toxin of MazEF toxin-antitoxin module